MALVSFIRLIDSESIALKRGIGSFIQITSHKSFVDNCLNQHGTETSAFGIAIAQGDRALWGKWPKEIGQFESLRIATRAVCKFGTVTF